MCRAGDDNSHYYTNTYPQLLLRINSVYVRFPGHGPRGPPFPDSMTLVYLPRISEAELEINRMKIRPDAPAFVTLYRVRYEDDGRGVAFGCREKVLAGAGLRFEVYIGEEKLLRGTFRKDGGVGKSWGMECRCAMERETAVRDGDVAEVIVGVEGGRGELWETVRMVLGRRKSRGKRDGFRNGLEEIPEECEAEGGWYDDTSCGGRCSCCDDGSDGEYEDEVNTEGVKWAVDVGIWVFCLGVGFLVSRASSSSKKLRRRRIL